MSIEIARYQFHAWTRKGISAAIIEDDDLGTGAGTTKERAEITLPVLLNTETKNKTFSLIGPGDIIGINRDMIIRTEPLNYITDFEPNYLAFVEAYDEDFWTRYTPAAPVGSKLRPWVILLVLKEDEFTPGKQKQPLPTINITNKDAFPPFDETWLWTHVHSNAAIPPEELSNYEKFLLSLNQTMNDDPDQYYSRLLCPRRLEPNTPYHAFIIPAFETGRRAGLGQDTANINAQTPSWDTNGTKGEMPVYFEWYFRTGINADFESLVKLLEPRPMDAKVGIRDMDASEPGFIQAHNTNPLDSVQPDVIGLEGALKSPSTVSTVFPDPDKPNLFQPELQDIVNLPFEITGTDASGDPVISVPLYGGKHAKKKAGDIVKLDTTKENWVNDLNRDPRTRVPAGFGTKVIQLNQENYMRRAWQQVDSVIQANKRIRLTGFYMKVALQYTKKTFSAVSGDQLVAISKPLLKRVMGSPATLHQQLKESRLPGVVYSPAFRKITRPSTKLMKALPPQKKYEYPAFIKALNQNEITAAPEQNLPAVVLSTQQLSDNIKNTNKQPDWLVTLTKYKSVALIILIILFVLIAIFTGAFLLVGVAVVAAIIGYTYINRIADQQKTAETVAAAILDPAEEIKFLQTIPQRPAFSLKITDEATQPRATSTVTGRDSVEAANFRVALNDSLQRLSVNAPIVAKNALNMDNLYKKLSDGIHPHKTFPFRLKAWVKFPGYIKVDEPEQVLPVMAYPDYEDPMYKGLTAISSELLLPNLKLVPPNTISLLKVNQKFIESYMVGLNHEMGRELLWREYPTDERGSYFRQFWDVNGVIRPADGKTDAERREDFKDIDPIHTWKSDSLLGSHNKREPVAGDEQLVLIIRGDLLKRYPNTVVFAQKAIPNPDGPVDPGIRTDFDGTEGEAAYLKELKFPLYKAEITPDIKFFGFDLSLEQARGSKETDGFPGDGLGWFFVIQEVPGEPRFGMDIQPAQSPSTWDDLSWESFGANKITMIKKTTAPDFSDGGSSINWGADSSAMAYILFQKPSMVAVHAKDMLEKLTN